MSIFKRVCKDLLKPVKFYNLLRSNRTATSYKSDLALDALYPNSNLTITDPKFPSNDAMFTGYIPLEELEISYSKSSGPGGQNVNKVNTKVDLRFKLQSAKWLSDEAKHKMLEKFHTKLTKDGYLIFKSDLTRSQQLNVADCLEKLRKAVRDSVEVKSEPSIVSQERARRRLEKAVAERLLIKRQRSQVKNDRRDSNITVE